MSRAKRRPRSTRGQSTPKQGGGSRLSEDHGTAEREGGSAERPHIVPPDDPAARTAPGARPDERSAPGAGQHAATDARSHPARVPADPVPRDSAPSDPTASDSMPSDVSPADPVPRDSVAPGPAASDSMPSDVSPADPVSADPVPPDATPSDLVPTHRPGPVTAGRAAGDEGRPIPPGTLSTPGSTATLGRPPTPGRRPTAGPRTTRLRISEGDPWSVMATSFLLLAGLGVIAVAGTLAVWTVLNTMAPEDLPTLTTTLTVGGGVVVLEVLLGTCFATLSTFLYNLSAPYHGGVQVAVTDDLTDPTPAAAAALLSLARARARVRRHLRRHAPSWATGAMRRLPHTRAVPFMARTRVRVRRHLRTHTPPWASARGTRPGRGPRSSGAIRPTRPHPTADGPVRTADDADNPQEVSDTA